MTRTKSKSVMMTLTDLLIITYHCVPQYQYNAHDITTHIISSYRSDAVNIDHIMEVLIQAECTECALNDDFTALVSVK